MKRLIRDTYDGHGGAGYRYGCSNVHMDKHCEATCKLYKSKKSQNALSADSMEDELIKFLKSGIKPIDIGALYGKKFPIYPGEVVVLLGPPKSMKTMLLQNWLNELKRPTYFLELEMSARQMMSRFAMMETGMNEEELNSYLLNGGRVADKFKWLTIDYSPCRAYDVQKRIQMQPIKPEIVVIDHLGLFHSNHKDNNMKVEEASQAMMELATQNNLVVFVVSEIGKESFKEGMNISSAKGSFRVAYNANKVMGVTPKKDSDGLVQSLTVATIANRERESLNIKLDVDNVKLTIAKEVKPQKLTYME
jgi:KaiC/GvpD/RAD55 family RecA-like ATPase